MTEKKMETISFGSVKDYAKVSTRVAALHEDHEKCNVETSCEFKDGFVLFTATVTNKKGTFTGHSMGKVGGKAKEFEKQETIAVGRALGFAGYLASGEIATYEEMVDLANAVTATQLNSLKLKFFNENKDSLERLDRPEQAKRFGKWCKDITGEMADFSDPNSWETEWYRQCWQELVGADVDIPFGE